LFSATTRKKRFVHAARAFKYVTKGFPLDIERRMLASKNVPTLVRRAFVIIASFPRATQQYS
jgi:hypothetical protein